MKDPRLQQQIASGTTYTYVGQKLSKPFYTKYYPTDQERKLLMQEVGANGLVLYEYLMRLASIGNEGFDDKSIARYFGWSIRTAERYRLALIANDWLYVSKTSNSKTNQKAVAYYLGKEVVQELKKFHGIP